VAQGIGPEFKLQYCKKQQTIKQKPHNVIPFIFVFVVVLGFELRASYLLGRHTTTWVTLPALPHVVLVFSLEITHLQSTEPVVLFQ
jgi:lipid-A-disaccharide synthase-like uncharacterized protein